MLKLNFKGKSKIQIVAELKALNATKEISDFEFNMLMKIYG